MPLNEPTVFFFELPCPSKRYHANQNARSVNQEATQYQLSSAQERVTNNWWLEGIEYTLYVAKCVEPLLLGKNLASSSRKSKSHL